MRSKRTKSLLVAVVVLIGISAWLASLDETVRILVNPSFIATTGKIALGPVHAWIEVIHEGKLTSALPLLVLGTFVSSLPIGLWIAKRRLLWLAIAVIAWAATGYMFTVAIWI